MRHLVLFNENFAFGNFITIINGAFLTMFVYKIGVDVKEGMDNKDGKVRMSVYVEWAMGSLVSGIIFASSNYASQIIISKGLLYLVAIVIFAFVSNYFLFNLRQKMKRDEDKKKDENSTDTQL